jgi:RHS repeat-associated protein
LANANATGTANGLNQLTAYGGASITHDARGNVSAIGSAAYGYDSANRMTSAAGAPGYIYYEPLGRMSFIFDPAGSTVREYSGARLIGESGAVARRYVHGAGIDEPLVWYEGSGTTTRRWFHADERGSVIAVSDGSGNPVGSINRYDDYGSPQGGAITGRFGYTGQAWIPEIGMYDYRARIYNPALGGRFMQTDPIGYGDGMNLYLSPKIRSFARRAKRAGRGLWGHAAGAAGAGRRADRGCPGGAVAARNDRGEPGGESYFSPRRRQVRRGSWEK